MPNKDPEFIVAEVSKNWIAGHGVTDTPLLAVQFEQVIDVNWQRGYRLVQFALNRFVTRPGELNETIIAVFQRVRDPLDDEDEE
jgi:hypothetical protein